MSELQGIFFLCETRKHVELCLSITTEDNNLIPEAGEVYVITYSEESSEVDTASFIPGN